MNQQAMDHLIVHDVSKAYGRLKVLDHINISIQKGELITLLGPSGCGKTTLLRLLAGLGHPDTGRIELASRDITHMPPHKRNVGVVFQSYALFPHLTVAGNVAFGLKVRKRPAAEIDQSVRRTLSLVHLEHLADRSISALSGGQQQRVALARALAVEPTVILFDEALSALDRKLREEMQMELRRLLRDIGATAIFVTHDQDEALTMSDRIAVMHQGRIQQLADPRSLYNKPSTLFALSFVGQSVCISGKAVATDGNITEFDTDVGRLRAKGSFALGEMATVATRPEHIRFGRQDQENTVKGRVRSVTFQGSRTMIELHAGQFSILAEIPDQGLSVPVEGEEVTVGWPVADTLAFTETAIP